MNAPIHIDFEPFEAFQKQVRELKPTKIGLIVDSNTSNYCLPTVHPLLPEARIFTIPAGEEHKTLETCQKLWAELLEADFDRHSLIINLGGGVVGDLGGFVAGTFKRGIRFIQMPTTLLAMVDASIGGKTGVDFQGGKNLIGLFRQPEAVFVDTGFLDTLPEREKRSGFAEVIKHWLIGDSNAWEARQPIHLLNWQKVISDAIEVKRKVVEEDPFEKGLRKALNFGHTIGHALESCSLETASPLLHGEAVALGMIAECKLALQKGLLQENTYLSVRKYILNHYTFSPDLFKQIGQERYFEFLKKDKKNKGGKILLSVIEEVGRPTWDVEASPEELWMDWNNLIDPAK